ncbi:hypothetical protein [Massilia sp. PWRC2]|uniref:hypothetical protein n=1 Tax=Massilia sp. PWRC2 TaxID=2804626 RepID=UPI003CF5E15A
MQELELMEIEQISGGLRANTNELGIGIGLMSLGLGIAAVSGIGLVGIAAAGALSYGGGLLTGDGAMGGFSWGSYF